MSEDRAIRAWLLREKRKLNRGVVDDQRPLSELLREDRPKAKARKGEHIFDADALRRFSTRLSPLMRSECLLPIQFYIHGDDDEGCFLTEHGAWVALSQWEVPIDDYDEEEGKAWMFTKKVRELQDRFPTIAQFVRL